MNFIDLEANDTSATRKRRAAVDDADSDDGGGDEDVDFDYHLFPDADSDDEQLVHELATIGTRGYASDPSAAVRSSRRAKRTRSRVAPTRRTGQRTPPPPSPELPPEHQPGVSASAPPALAASSALVAAIAGPAAEPQEPASDDELADIGREAKVEPGKAFRVNCRRLLLTYAQADGLSVERLRDFLTKERGASHYLIGTEHHADGGLHYHCYVERKSRFSTRDVRYFDIDGHHPNIRVVSRRGGAIEYCAKDGDFIQSAGLRLFDSSANFVRRLADFSAWTAFASARLGRDVPVPLVLPDGQSSPGPVVNVKRRHILLHGAPSTGKSFWLNRVFGGSKVYHVPKTGHQFDSYFGQPWILFDDAEPFPSKGLLTTLTESCSFVRYLPARYNNRVLPPNWCGCVVIVCNTEDIPQERGASLLDVGWFTERFLICHVELGDIRPSDS